MNRDIPSKQQVASALEILRGSGMLQAVNTVSAEIDRLRAEVLKLESHIVDVYNAQEAAQVETPAESPVRVLRAALERIAKWSGEFPPTGRTWDDGTPMSYAACYGSNGERDFMRGIAVEALDAAERPAQKAEGPRS